MSEPLSLPTPIFSHDYTYLSMLQEIKQYGRAAGDRTGTGTKRIFGHMMRFDLSRLPLLTTKKVFVRGIIEELLWMLRGSTNNNELVDKDVHIWDQWAAEDGSLGPIYGEMWRAYPGENGVKVDQIQDVINLINTDPNSRRLIVCTWNPALLPDTKLSPKENAANGRQALPPCHAFFQFRVEDGKLDCLLYQRSADSFLGVPFNIVQYSLLVYMIAKLTGLQPGQFVWVGGDVHIYSNHWEQVDEQLTRSPHPSPLLEIHGDQKTINDFKVEDFQIIGYECHPAIKAPVSV